MWKAQLVSYELGYLAEGERGKERQGEGEGGRDKDMEGGTIHPTGSRTW